MSIKDQPFKKIDNLALILVNLAPLLGIFFYSWDIFNVLFLYWTESAVIGFYNILKLIKAGLYLKVNILGIFFLIVFFIIHYGGFMIGHLVFIIAIANNAFSNPGVPFQPNLPIDRLSLFILMLGLMISHGISFYQNFIKNREYIKIRQLGFVMMAPYKRIMVMHTTLLIGSFMIIPFKIPLIFLVILKIVLDYSAHNKEHRKISYKNQTI